jgi:hypothetical protein
MLTQSLILFVNPIKMSIFAYQTFVYEHGRPESGNVLLRKNRELWDF